MNDPKYLIVLEGETEVFTTSPLRGHVMATTIAAYDVGEETQMHTEDAESVPATKVKVDNGYTYVPTDAVTEVREL